MSCRLLPCIRSLGKAVCSANARAGQSRCDSPNSGSRSFEREMEFANDQPYYKGVKADSRLTPYLEQGGNGSWKLTLPACVFPGYRADGAPSHVTTLLPNHPIAAGLPEKWDIPQTEMYNEPFQCQLRMRWCLKRSGTKASDFVAVVFGESARGRSSIFDLAMRPIQFTNRPNH